MELPLWTSGFCRGSAKMCAPDGAETSGRGMKSVPRHLPNVRPCVSPRDVLRECCHCVSCDIVLLRWSRQCPRQSLSRAVNVVRLYSISPLQLALDESCGKNPA